MYQLSPQNNNYNNWGKKKKTQAHTHYWETYSKMCNHKMNYHSLGGEKGIQWTTKKTSTIAHCKLHCIMFSWSSFFAPLLECMHLLTLSKNLCHWVPIFVSILIVFFFITWRSPKPRELALFFIRLKSPQWVGVRQGDFLMFKLLTYNARAIEFGVISSLKISIKIKLKKLREITLEFWVFFSS